MSKRSKGFSYVSILSNSRLTKEDIVEKIQCKYPFKVEKANCGWFNSFKLLHPQLSFFTPLSVSDSGAVSANEYTIITFFQG